MPNRIVADIITKNITCLSINKNVMKKKLFLIILSLIGINTLFAQKYSKSMETIFTDPVSTSAHLQHVKSAVDSKGNLYVVFIGEANQSYFGTNRGGEWKFQPLVYYNEDYKEEDKATNYPNIAIDKNDNISLVIAGRYKEKLYWETKNVSKCTEKWEFKDAGKESEFMKFSLMDEYADMCVDNDGGLHLYCCANVGQRSSDENWMSATYFYKPANTNKWLMEMIMPGIANEVSYAADPSIATAGGKVFVTIGGSKNLHFASKDISGGKWYVEDFQTFVDKPEAFNTWKYETSITTDPKGNPIWAFYEYSGESDNHGINILSKSDCGSGNWIIDHSIDEPVSKRAPAIAVNKNGKTYLAFGGNSSFSLYAKVCNCKQTWEKVFEQEGNSTPYADIIVDNNDVVSIFYTSEYDNHLYLLTVKENDVAENCNYPPVFTNHTGKTNLTPGEKWTATITASDFECDKIKFESIIHNDIFTIKDHGNGTATISATMPEGQGKGTPGISIWVLDDKHPDINDEVSVINYYLIITPEGKEKGSVKVENKCGGNNGNITATERSNEPKVVTNQKQAAVVGKPENKVESNTGSVHVDCEKFLDRYEAYAEKHVKLVKQIKDNPTDTKAAMELSSAMEEFSNYTIEWINLFDCSKNPEFKARYDKTTTKIQNAN